MELGDYMSVLPKWPWFVRLLLCTRDYMATYFSEPNLENNILMITINMIKEEKSI